MNTARRWKTVPVCSRGHNLSSRTSFRRMSNNHRYCLACAELRHPMLPKRAYCRRPVFTQHAGLPPSLVGFLTQTNLNVYDADRSQHTSEP